MQLYDRTFEEAERRTRQVEQLQSKNIQLQKLYEPHTIDYVSSRASLLRAGSSVFADGGTTSWAIDDDDDDDDKPLNVQVSVGDIMNHQEQILKGNNYIYTHTILKERINHYTLLIIYNCIISYRTRQRLRRVM